MHQFCIGVIVDRRCLAMMKYSNYDAWQDGMDNKARKEWLPWDESGIKVCAIIRLLKGC